VFKKVKSFHWATTLVFGLKVDETLKVGGDFKVTTSINELLNVPQYPISTPDKLLGSFSNDDYDGNGGGTSKIQHV